MKNYFIQTTNTHSPFVAFSYFPRKLVRYAFFQFCSPLALCMKRLCITISVQIKKEESTSAPIGSVNKADTAMPFDEMNWCCSLKIHRIFCVYDTPIYQNMFIHCVVPCYILKLGNHLFSRRMSFILWNARDKSHDNVHLWIMLCTNVSTHRKWQQKWWNKNTICKYKTCSNGDGKWNKKVWENEIRGSGAIRGWVEASFPNWKIDAHDIVHNT